MKLTTFHTAFVETVTFLLIILFIYTGLSKLIDHNKFQIVIYATGMLTGNQSHFVAYAIPGVECIVAVALIIPKWRVAGLGLAALLMGAFTIYVATMLAFATKLPCSCGGVISAMSWKQHLVFNAAFAICSLIAFWRSMRHQFFIAINRSRRIPV